MDEAAELVTLWGSALAGATAREAQAAPPGARAAAAAEDAEEEYDSDGGGGGDGEEWGLPLLGVDLSALAQSGFGRAEAEALGLSALLAASGGGGGGGAQVAARAGGLLAGMVWRSLRGMAPLAGEGAAAAAAVAQLARLPVLDAAALRRAFPVPTQGHATVVVVALGGGGGGGVPALVGGLRLPLPPGASGERGSAGGALWDALSETLLARGCAFHASTCVCSGDVRAWAARQGAGAGSSSSGGGAQLRVLALLPHPSEATWGPAQRSAPSLWRTIATPRASACLGVEALRTLIEAAHRTLLFKWALLGEVEALARLARDAASAALAPLQPWHQLTPALLGQNPLLRCLLPLCDRQYARGAAGGGAGAGAGGAGDDADAEAPPHAHAHLAAAALTCAVEGALGAARGSTAVDWAALAAPGVCEALDAWQGAVGALPWRAVDVAATERERLAAAAVAEGAAAVAGGAAAEAAAAEAAAAAAAAAEVSPQRLTAAAAAASSLQAAGGGGGGEAAALSRLFSRVSARAAGRAGEAAAAALGPSLEDIRAGRLAVSAPRGHILRGGVNGGREGGVLGNPQDQVASVLDSIAAFRGGGGGSSAGR